MSEGGRSSEAQAYKAWLNAESKGKKLPSKEDREDTKSALRGVRERRQKRAAGDAPEARAAAQAGKERLESFLERGDLPEVSINRLAVYLECEPWQALERLEAAPDILDWIVRGYKTSTGARESYITVRSRGDDLQKFARTVLAYRLQEMDEARNLMEQAALRLLPRDHAENIDAVERENEFEGHIYRSRVSRGYGDGYKDASKHQLTEESPWTIARDRIAVLTRPSFASRGYWTIQRTVAAEVPAYFGYKDGKEATRTIDAYAEKIGRMLGHTWQEREGAFYAGKATPEQKKLRALDIQSAREIAREHRSIFAEAGRKLQTARREKLLRLNEINEELGRQLPVKRTEGWLSRLARSLGGESRADIERRQRHAALNREREGLYKQLEEAEDRATTNRNPAIFEDYRPSRGNYMDYWDRKAAEEPVRIVDEEPTPGARAKLEAMKEELRSK